MGAATQVSVEEYLRTSYDPDRDYIEGVVEERNLGEQEHSLLQSLITHWFWLRGRELELRPLTEQRLKVAERRYRVPDICVVRGPRPDQRILSEPPYICIEILSAEDRLSRMQARADDYIAMGVPNIWIIDPEDKRTWTADAGGIHDAKDRVLRTGDGLLAMPLADVYALDF